MPRILSTTVFFVLMAMAFQAKAATYDIFVTGEGDKVFYRYWGYFGSGNGWIVDANPNQVSHSYWPGDGNSMETALSFDLTSFSAPVDEIVSVSFNFNILSIWTEGRDDVSAFGSFGTVNASGGTGWKYFDVTNNFKDFLLAGTSSSIDYYFSYTGYSGFTFSSAEGGAPSYLRITTAGPTPTPEPATMILFGTGLAGLVGVARRKKKD